MGLISVLYVFSVTGTNVWHENVAKAQMKCVSISQQVTRKVSFAPEIERLHVRSLMMVTF